MTEALREAQKQSGAVVESGVLSSFGNDAAAVQAARQSVAVYDRSHWGCLQVTGADRLAFLHNQSTNDFKRLQPGQGCDTVFVTSTARTIDLATAYVLEDSVLLLVSPNRRETLLTWLDRYIFFGDNVALSDITAQTIAFSVIGPESDRLLERLGAGSLLGQPESSHQVVELAGQQVRIAVGNGLALLGYTIILESDKAALVWEALVQAGAVPFGDRAWEHLRVEQGRPLPDRELTEDYNPLEAGLWQTLSFNKGCYIGQETIARLDTYKGVKQQLWGVRLTATAAPGTIVTLGDEKVGVLTSQTNTEHGSFGLAYIRTKAGGAGLKVHIGEAEADVVDVPFLTHDRAASQ
ncbi:folate-binding protein YgfZ [Leptolyngbya sp. FACHB-36]|uniref:CAF17-like 4Fe-4S cluster assembly/insertion protein YgfZ n=1 Tax=Leptolyngbya sp. FACHB-36 TaxID=2692808 RepID=UPI001681995D|nr:folate-binding protein YgfZ [Leptolyngbya sp. FACHB-36]MBD2020429.1 folate-binding protein YgfZ [Leptolyngbya sp. FACHB-36]